MSIWTNIEKDLSPVQVAELVADPGKIISDLENLNASPSTTPASGGGGGTTVSPTASSAGSALLTIGLEIGAVGLFAVIANSGDNAASIMLIVMTGLWIMWAIQNSASIGRLGGLISGVSAL
jgi:hypothetical protein